MLESLLTRKRRLVAGDHDLLLHFDDAIVDASGNYTISNSGMVLQSTNSKWGGKSAQGTSNTRLAISSSDGGLIVPGDFTAEFWGYQTAPTSGSYPCAMYDPAQNIQLHLNTPSGSRGGYWSGVRPVSAGGLYSLNVWNHFAWVRFGTRFLCFINGKKQLDYALSGVATINFTTIFGPNGYGFPGYIDEFAFKQAAKWISDFDVPSGPYAN